MNRLRCRFLLFAVLLMLALGTIGCGTKRSEVYVFVSILPQKYFVERIAGDNLTVSVMVQPGHSPETYDPSPKQMIQLSDAAVYFSIGVPFEQKLMPKIHDINKSIVVVDTLEGIQLRDIESHVHDGDETDAEHQQAGAKDPHVWLSPSLVRIQAQNIAEALIELDPKNAQTYTANLQIFVDELDELSREITLALQDVKSRYFMVFHPSWGYFADEFGLVQIPIEMQGREPSGKELQEIVNLGRELGVGMIFVQSQFSAASAQTVADVLGVPVITIDPLAEDYVSNLQRVVGLFAKELSK